MARPLNPKPNPADLARVAEERERQEREERARKLWAEATAWRKAHPDAWGYARRMAVAEASAGRRFGAQFLIESIRKRDFASFGSPYPQINNDFAPAFARMLLLERPELRRWVELRASALDALPGVPKRREPAEKGENSAA